MARFYTVFLILFSVLAFSLPANAQRTAEEFGKLPFMQDPEISPDGNRIATLLSINGEQKFAIWPLSEELGEPVVMNLGDGILMDWRWVNKDWLVIRTASIGNVQGSEWFLTRLSAIRADGKKSYVIGKRDMAQNGGDILWTATDGSPRIIMAYQTSIYLDNSGFWPQVDEVNLETGKRKELVSPVKNIRNWYADGAGTVRMGLGYDYKRDTLIALYRDSNSDHFEVLDTARDDKDENLVVPMVFPEDRTKAIVIDDADGFDALYEYDLTTLERGAKIFGVDGFDIDGVYWDKDRTGVKGIQYTDTQKRVEWKDPFRAKLQKILEDSVPGKTITVVSWNRAEDRFVVSIGTPSSPGKYYIFDAHSNRLTLLASVNSALKSAVFGPVKTIKYAARDGLEIPAVLTLPKNGPQTGLPLIMMPHGGPHVRDAERWDWWVQFLADRGYAVMQPNYRGSTGHGNKFEKMGDGEWGLAMQDDLDDGVKWAVSQGIADAKRVCIVGGSYGGYAAMRAAQRNPDMYRCAISYAGVSDLAKLKRHDSQFLAGRRMARYWREQSPDLDAVSPINHIEKFATPILIIHGKEDQRVPYGQSKDLAKKLQSAGKTVRYVEQPEADHYFSREADRVEFLKEMDAFLKKHNPG